MGQSVRAHKIDHAFKKMYRDDALREQNGRCLYCLDCLNYKTATLEHRKAKANGGGITKHNSAASCERCNRLKSSMSETLFKNMIKHPKPSDSIAVWMAWSRRKINLSVDRLDRNLSRRVGCGVNVRSIPV